MSTLEEVKNVYNEHGLAVGIHVLLWLDGRHEQDPFKSREYSGLPVEETGPSAHRRVSIHPHGLQPHFRGTP